MGLSTNQGLSPKVPIIGDSSTASSAETIQNLDDVVSRFRQQINLGVQSTVDSKGDIPSSDPVIAGITGNCRYFFGLPIFAGLSRAALSPVSPTHFGVEYRSLVIQRHQCVRVAAGIECLRRLYSRRLFQFLIRAYDEARGAFAFGAAYCVMMISEYEIQIVLQFRECLDDHRGIMESRTEDREIGTGLSERHKNLTAGSLWRVTEFGATGRTLRPSNFLSSVRAQTLEPAWTARYSCVRAPHS